MCTHQDMDAGDGERGRHGHGHRASGSRPAKRDVIGTFGPAGPPGGWRTVYSGGDRSDERTCPSPGGSGVGGAGAPRRSGSVTRAAAIALNCYRESASVSEACRQASDFVGSWTRHPAHCMLEQDAVVRLVS